MNYTYEKILNLQGKKKNYLHEIRCLKEEIEKKEHNIESCQSTITKIEKDIEEIKRYIYKK